MKNRADTPEQKAEVLATLLEVWKENPGLRLTQLIGNVYHVPSGNDPYYVEDYRFVDTIKQYYGNLNKE